MRGRSNNHRPQTVQFLWLFTVSLGVALCTLHLRLIDTFVAFRKENDLSFLYLHSFNNDSASTIRKLDMMTNHDVTNILDEDTPNANNKKNSKRKDDNVINKYNYRSSNNKRSSIKKVMTLEADTTNHNAAHSKYISKRKSMLKEVRNRFGKNPIIIGLERCDAFRKAVPRQQRLVGPAGAFNSGTNFLNHLLHANCRIPGTGKSNPNMLLQVNWGKHQSPLYRFNNSLRKRIRNHQILPVVTIRDPYSWMQSMCKVRYAANWYHVIPYHCPNLIPNHVEWSWYNKTRRWLYKHYSQEYELWDNVSDKANFTLDSHVIPVSVKYKSYTAYHKSLVHMWKDWYQDYYDASFPRLMVRLEDLVFHPVAVLQQVCSCFGGITAKEITVRKVSAKIGPSHGNNRTGFMDAMERHAYGNRTKNMTKEDRIFAEYVLKDSIMSRFRYTPPHI